MQRLRYPGHLELSGEQRWEKRMLLEWSVAWAGDGGTQDKVMMSILIPEAAN